MWDQMEKKKLSTEEYIKAKSDFLRGNHKREFKQSVNGRFAFG